MRLFPVLLLLLGLNQYAYNQNQATDCALEFGTNMSGMADWGTELPFVDLMHNARTWYTKDVDNPEYPFDSGHASELSYRSDGYPTHLPQDIPGSTYLQEVATIWAITDGWPSGEYTVLWDGTGELNFWGTYESLTQTSSNRAVFQFPDPVDGVVELRIAVSDAADPIRNIRVLMPGTEHTYLDEPFYQPWIERLTAFGSVRFMDWGQTNNWGEAYGEGWEDPSLTPWAERSPMDHYTWAYEKGIPYEMMVRLMNDYDLDGWVCVPHRASDEYIREMAIFFKENLEPERHLTVEYSNEIWNWIFGQTHWLNQYGCIETGTSWPEGLVPYVQNCLDIWTDVFAEEPQRITRAVGAFTGWLDITDRITQNMTPGSFDAVACTYYFGLPEAGDEALDALGDAATVADVAAYARQGMAESFAYITDHKEQITDPLGVELNFYEGGQHLTPHPFGVEPTYGQALLDIQRDTAMYNLYTEWFAALSSLQSGEEPLQLMNFSFVGVPSARYGTWGILETIEQDFDAVPAPKYRAIMDYMENCGAVVSTNTISNTNFQVYPNPTSGLLQLSSLQEGDAILLFNQLGQQVLQRFPSSSTLSLDVSALPSGVYYLHHYHASGSLAHRQKLVKS